MKSACRRKRSGNYLLLATVLSLAGCGPTANSQAGDDDPNTPPSLRTNTPEYAQAKEDGIAALKNSLRDPYSAVITVDAVDPSTKTVCGTVNAKNGFGGYIGEEDFVVKDGEVAIMGQGDHYTKLIQSCIDLHNRQTAYKLAKARSINAELAKQGVDTSNSEAEISAVENLN